MRSFLFRTALFLSVLACAACAKHARLPVLAAAPPGVVIPRGLKDGAEYRGLHLTASADHGVWTASDATITVVKKHPATRLVLVLYLSDRSDAFKAWYQKHPVGISVGVDGAEAQARCCFGGGIANAEFSLPPRLREKRGDVVFTLHVNGSVIPHEIDPAFADRRRLGINLVRLFFY